MCFMSVKKVLNPTVLCLFFLSLTWCAGFAVASYEDDPIRKTQSDVVPVTKELLTREGELGPASPSFKMPDTSSFLIKKEYQEAEEVKQANDLLEEDSSEFGDDWFFWEDDELNSKSELVEKK